MSGDRETEREDEQQQSSDKKTINDPLTRSDEAPRKPFGGDEES
jgi:hypothetical protein